MAGARFDRANDVDLTVRAQNLLSSVPSCDVTACHSYPVLPALITRFSAML
ncbi:hypothetical protein RLO149_c036030 [Roseobacter litoralis Och 149]|uniref:Uncharacterized protein n=1 Tax=Roseobacter litoralis (strain ATCC 49566 / DSM 6996 / JCM 21268 / NBRC 15278 / OCh 149) TaxID=391595 RepID=F7ZB00_ROSLO|nr:hypothetical protein RLO149_c036030 [Roseobacter litoralis Och 149]